MQSSWCWRSVRAVLFARSTIMRCVFLLIGVCTPTDQVTSTRGGNAVHEFTVADETGAITLSLWNEKGDALSLGDIVLLSGGYVTSQLGALPPAPSHHQRARGRSSKIFHDVLVLHVGYGSIEIVGNFCMVFAETPNLSRIEWRIDDPDNPQAAVRTSYLRELVRKLQSSSLPPGAGSCAHAPNRVSQGVS